MEANEILRAQAALSQGGPSSTGSGLIIVVVGLLVIACLAVARVAPSQAESVRRTITFHVPNVIQIIIEFLPVPPPTKKPTGGVKKANPHSRKR
jgi:hypothetical protein